MSKHLVDIDEDALRAARAKLGSATIKETVNRALRQAGEDHRRILQRRLDSLAEADLADREQAWREDVPSPVELRLRSRLTITR